jgi:hypothetical protein
MHSKLRSIQVEYVAGDTALQRMLQASRRGLTVRWNPICFQFRQNIETEYLIAKLNQSIHNIGQIDIHWATCFHIKTTRNARKVNKITDICHDQWIVWKIPRSRSNGNCIAQLGVSISISWSLKGQMYQWQAPTLVNPSPSNYSLIWVVHFCGNPNILDLHRSDSLK